MYERVYICVATLRETTASCLAGLRHRGQRQTGRAVNAGQTRAAAGAGVAGGGRVRTGVNQGMGHSDF